LRQQLTLNQGTGSAEEDESGLPAVPVRRVVLAAQDHVPSAHDGRECRGAVGFARPWRGLFDAGQSDLAAIGKPNAAAIDDISDMAFAQRFQGTSFRNRRLTRAGQCKTARAQDCGKSAPAGARGRFAV
jgi:hypothetical protein